MWLETLESGQDRTARIMFACMQRLTGTEVPAVLKVLCYRHRFFGTPFSDLIQEVMRGPSSWTVAEREIFATRTSQSNQCPFCHSAHRGIAGAYVAAEVVDRALADGDDSPLRPEARAMLDYLGKMVRDPDALTPGDADTLRASGISATAFDEAIWVATLFNVISRVMNTVGAQALEDHQSRVGARFIKAFGYRVPPPVRLFSRGA